MAVLAPALALLDQRVGERVPEGRLAAEHQLLAEGAAERLEATLTAEAAGIATCCELGIDLRPVDRNREDPKPELLTAGIGQRPGHR